MSIIAGTAVLASVALALPAAATTPDQIPHSFPQAKLSVQTKKSKAQSGKLRIRISGVQRGKAAVVVQGPKKYRKLVTKSGTLKKLRPGNYRFAANTVTLSTTVYTPEILPGPKFKVRSGKTTKARVRYRGKYNPPPQTPPAPVVPLRLNIRDAAGVAVPESRAQAATTNVQAAAAGADALLAVNRDGTTRSAIEQGTIPPTKSIMSTFAAPDGSLVIGYSGYDTQRTAGGYDQPIATCMLGHVSRQSGEQTCLIMKEGMSVGAMDNPQATSPNADMSVQFDDSGRIYYAGAVYNQQQTNYYIRRYDNGVTTDMLNLPSNNFQLNGWVVASDGTIVVQGGDILWAISPSKSVRSLGAPSSGYVRPLPYQFPDGNVYLSWTGSSQAGIKRYLVNQGVLDPQFWIANGANVTSPTWDTQPFCALPAPAQFCGTIADGVGFTKTQSNSVWGITSYSSSERRAFQYYPSLTVAGLSIKPRTLTAVGDMIAVSGSDAGQRQVTLLYDPATEKEQPLLGADNEVMVYHLNYSPASGLIMFDGLRYADATYVIGTIDPETGTASMRSSDRLAQFITFSR